MIVRKIRPEEYKRVMQFCSLAFEYTMDNADVSADELIARTQQNPGSMQDLHWDSQWAAFADDDYTMMSTFTAIPYRTHFDGHTVGMMGIGGVVTLPEYRRLGGIRACFERALPDFYAQGMAFSYLYPFSTVFYRKFGYELGCGRALHKINLNAVPATDVKGTFHLLEPGVDLAEEIRQVSQVMQNQYNLMVLDEDVDLQWIGKANPFRDKVYTYVYRSADGTPKGVVTYHPVMDEGDRALDCTTRFLFTDPEGLQALVHLLTRLKADHSHALINLPESVRIDALIPEWSFGNIKRSIYLNGMVRVVNVEQVLALAKMRGEGELVIEVSDPQIKQNNDRFVVRFAPGQRNAVERTTLPADVSMTIQDFSRLISGKFDVSDWLWLPDVRLHCDAEKAACVFYRKPLFINKFF